MSDLGSFVGLGPLSGFEPTDGISFVTADSGATPFKLGTRRTYNGEEYVWIHNAQASTALTVGELCTTSGLSGYSLTNATTAGADLALAGIKHVDIPSAGYGWGLRRGIMESLGVSTTAATGVLLTVGTDGSSTPHVSGSFPTGPAIGKVLSSGTSAVKAYVVLHG